VGGPSASTRHAYLPRPRARVRAVNLTIGIGFLAVVIWSPRGRR
jgi:hypothetical protein